MSEGFDTRYSYGADEWVFVELAEAMSVGVNTRAQAICRQLEEQEIEGIVDICCGNASYLLRVDPDRLDLVALVELLKEIEVEVGDALDFSLSTRITEVPVLWEDEWTHEVLMRFRDRHQAPDRTDLEFAAEVNGFGSTEEFKEELCATPLFGTMTGFVPGAVWLYPLSPSGKVIEVPKYLRPRTQTPERAFGWGGAFGALYPLPGAGGYQLFGIAATPPLDMSRRLPDFADRPWLFDVGDLVVITAIDRPEYDAIRAEVEAGTYRYHRQPFEFSPAKFIADPAATSKAIVGAIRGS